MKEKPIWAVNIQIVRNLIGKTQADFKINGFNKGKVQSYEDGRSQPRLEYLILLHRLSGISLDDILDGEIKTDGKKVIEQKLIMVEENQSAYNLPEKIKKLSLDEEIFFLKKRVERIENQLNIK